MMDPGLIRVLAVPAIALLFKVLPVRLQSGGLLKLAFLLWLLGGLSLLLAGYGRLSAAGAFELSPMMVAGLIIAVGVGLMKGRFVLAKTSAKNIERLQEFTAPRPLFDIYSMRSWIVIGVMLLISASLTWFSAPMMIRGFVNIAIGLALTVSSFRYAAAISQSSSTRDNSASNASA